MQIRHIFTAGYSYAQFVTDTRYWSLGARAHLSRWEFVAQAEFLCFEIYLHLDLTRCK